MDLLGISRLRRGTCVPPKPGLHCVLMPGVGDPELALGQHWQQPPTLAAVQLPFYPSTTRILRCDPRDKPGLFPLLQSRATSKHAWSREPGSGWWDQPELAQPWLGPSRSHEYCPQAALTSHCYPRPSRADPSYARAYLIFFTLWFKTISKASSFQNDSWFSKACHMKTVSLNRTSDSRSETTNFRSHASSYVVSICSS